MKVLNEYVGSHHYVERWEKCDYFCPNCGKKEVWEEQGGGDYYAGVDYVCVACDHFFYLPSGTFTRKDKNQITILEQLKTGKTNEPTTRPGN